MRTRIVPLILLAAVALLGVGTAGLAGGPAGAQTTDCAPLANFDPTRFPDVPAVTNGFLPMAPGTRLVFEGTSNASGQPETHRVEFTVSDMAKVINGVQTNVIWDIDTSGGELLESELAFFAQDSGGNVWGLGEYPEEFDGGEFVGAPSTWIDGQGDAQGGIHMPGDPHVGLPEYLQGSVPSIEFLDCAQVFAVGQSTCTPAGCFSDVLVTHERSPLDPGGGIQTKAHASGVGIVEIGAIDDPEGETLSLVEARTLGGAELAQVRAAVLELEARAYQVSQVYATTAPMVPLSDLKPPPPTTTPPTTTPPPPTDPPPPTGGGAPPTTHVTPVRVVHPTPAPARVKPVADSTVSRALALTGSNTVRVAMMATVAFAIGAAFVVATRRRRVAARLVGGVDDAPLPSDPSSALAALCAEAIALVDGLADQGRRTPRH